MLNEENAESRQLDPIAARHANDDFIEHSVDDLLNFARKEVWILVGDPLYELGLDHRYPRSPAAH